MVFITGDIHGDVNRIKKIDTFCKIKETTTKDVMILLGDVGINFHSDIRDTIRKDLMSRIPITFVCIRGNHDNRPENVSSYKTQIMFEGHVYIEPEYPNIIWLKDGETYKIENKSFLALGGAYSVDKHYRIVHGYEWFQNEQPTEEEMAFISENVKDKEYDIVLSHTCPYSWQPTELFLECIDQNTVDKTTEYWLENVKNSISFSKWYFGHFHGEKEVPDEKYEMLYQKIKQIT